MNLDEYKASAEKVLAGSDSAEAQEQARHVIEILDAKDDVIKAQQSVIEKQDQAIAQLEAEKGDLDTQKVRTRDAEAEVKALKAELRKAKKENEKLDNGLADRVEQAAAQLKEIFGGN